MQETVSQEKISELKTKVMDRFYETQDRVILQEDNSSFTQETKKINTVPHVVSRVKAGRKAGNTTRQLNDTIEALFEYGVVGFLDHAMTGEQQKLFRLKLIDRLKREHSHNHQIVRDWIPEDTVDRELRSRTIVIGKSYLKLIE